MHWTAALSLAVTGGKLMLVIVRNVSDEAIQRKNVCKDNLMHWTATAINRLAVTGGKLMFVIASVAKQSRNPYLAYQ